MLCKCHSLFCTSLYSYCNIDLEYLPFLPLTICPSRCYLDVISTIIFLNSPFHAGSFLFYPLLIYAYILFDLHIKYIVSIHNTFPQEILLLFESKVHMLIVWLNRESNIWILRNSGSNYSVWRVLDYLIPISLSLLVFKLGK